MKQTSNPLQPPIKQSAKPHLPSKRRATFSNIYSPFHSSSTSHKKPLKEEQSSFVKFKIDDNLIEDYIEEKTQNLLIERNPILDSKATKKRKPYDFKAENPLKEEKKENVEKMEKMEKYLKNSKIMKSSETEKKVSEILQKPSLKSKYEELLQAEIDYTLPSHYKTLLRLFEAIDETINFLKMRNQPQFFEELKENMKLLGNSLSYKFLRQILYLYPDAYVLSWERSLNFHNQYDLSIKIPLNENYIKSSFTHIRTDYFKELLIERVKSIQKEFLYKSGLAHLMEFYDNNRIWHPEFDIEKVPMIPDEGKLPEKPIGGQSVEALKEFLTHSQVKNQEFLKILEETAKNSNKEVKKINLLEKKEDVVMKKLGISDRLLEKIKEKELKLKDFQQKDMRSGPCIEDKKTKMIDLAETIKNHYILKGVSNMFLTYVIDFLKTSIISHVFNKEEIKELIDVILEICPYWMKLVQTAQGTILRIDKSIMIKRVLDDIKSFKRNVTIL